MANRLVPPRRDQPITKDGILDLRTAIYLEENTAQTNESTELTEADPASIRQITNVKGLLKRIEELENTTLADSSGLALKLIKALIERIEELENSITLDNSNIAIKLSKSIIERVEVLEISELASVTRKHEAQELIPNFTDNSILRRIEQLENSITPATSPELLKRIENLESTEINTVNGEVLKRIKALENTLIG